MIMKEAVDTMEGDHPSIPPITLREITLLSILLTEVGADTETGLLTEVGADIGLVPPSILLTGMGEGTEIGLHLLCILLTEVGAGTEEGLHPLFTLTEVGGGTGLLPLVHLLVGMEVQEGVAHTGLGPYRDPDLHLPMTIGENLSNNTNFHQELLNRWEAVRLYRFQN